MSKLKVDLFRVFVLSAIVVFMSGCVAMQPRAKADYILEKSGMEFAFVKGGPYQMGSEYRPEEQPIHDVTVNDLFVGMYEVTFAQFDSYCKATSGCELPADEGWGRGDRPVINVSWHDAKAFSAWLSAQSGQNIRLPSESEWEYFSRAGTTTEFWLGNTLPAEAANTRTSGDKSAHKAFAVGTFAPNPLRIYDTIGNVREWVLDDFQQDYTKTPKDGSPLIAAEPGQKVARGGSWRDSAKDSRSASRDYFPPETKSPYNGFRLVLEPDDITPVAK